MAGCTVVNTRTMFTMAVGAVFRLAEVIAVMRIDSGEVFLDFAGLRILHARNVVETVGFLGQLILIVASLALLGFNRFKLAGGMTLCAVHTALVVLTGLRHTCCLNGHCKNG